jgi:hypothetical protein
MGTNTTSPVLVRPSKNQASSLGRPHPSYYVIPSCPLISLVTEYDTLCMGRGKTNSSFPVLVLSNICSNRNMLKRVWNTRNSPNAKWVKRRVESESTIADASNLLRENPRVLSLALRNPSLGRNWVDVNYGCVEQ